MEIQFTKKSKKQKDGLTNSAKEILLLLEEDLRCTGGKPFGRGWKNLGPLRQCANNSYHCHLNSKIVAIWEIEDDSTCTIRYVGTHEKAPY